jgi:hypothetical protein
MLGDPASKFASQVISGYPIRIVLDEFEACSAMHIEPSLEFSFLLRQRLQDTLLIVGVELPIEYGNVAVVELVCGIAHYVLVQYYSSWLNGMFVLVVVVGNELLSQVIGH